MKQSTQANNSKTNLHALGQNVLLFSVGQTVATPGALALLDHVGVNASTFIARHQKGDFGDIDGADRLANAHAIHHRARILSAYVLRPGLRIWIITEADRSVTTLLLPEEY